MMKGNAIYNASFANIMRDTLRHGDQTAIGKALGLSAQVVSLMAQGSRRTPVEGAAILIETLRREGNPDSDALFLRLARRLGYATYRVEGQQVDDADFAELLRDFSGVVDERAKAEIDEVITPEERRAIAARLDVLINAAVKYRDEQLVLADDHEPKPARRIA